MKRILLLTILAPLLATAAARALPKDTKLGGYVDSSTPPVNPNPITVPALTGMDDVVTGIKTGSHIYVPGLSYGFNEATIALGPTTFVVGMNAVYFSGADTVFVTSPRSAPTTVSHVQFSSTGLMPYGSDPSVIWDGQRGRFYRTEVGIRHTQQPMVNYCGLDTTIYFSSSPDGVTWTPETQPTSSLNPTDPTFGIFHDHPSIHAGVHSLWIQFNGFQYATACDNPAYPYLLHSEDGGVTWSDPFPTLDPIAAQLFDPSESFTVIENAAGEDVALVPYTVNDAIYGEQFVGVRACKVDGTCTDMDLNNSELTHLWGNNNEHLEWASAETRVESSPGITSDGHNRILLWWMESPQPAHTPGREPTRIVAQYTTTGGTGWTPISRVWQGFQQMYVGDQFIAAAVIDSNGPQLCMYEHAVNFIPEPPNFVSLNCYTSKDGIHGSPADPNEWAQNGAASWLSVDAPNVANEFLGDYITIARNWTLGHDMVAFGALYPATDWDSAACATCSMETVQAEPITANGCAIYPRAGGAWLLLAPLGVLLLRRRYARRFSCSWG